MKQKTNSKNSKSRVVITKSCNKIVTAFTTPHFHYLTSLWDQKSRNHRGSKSRNTHSRPKKIVKLKTNLRVWSGLDITKSCGDWMLCRTQHKTTLHCKKKGLKLNPYASWSNSETNNTEDRIEEKSNSSRLISHSNLLHGWQIDTHRNLMNIINQHMLQMNELEQNKANIHDHQKITFKWYLHNWIEIENHKIKKNKLRNWKSKTIQIRMDPKIRTAKAKNHEIKIINSNRNETPKHRN